MYSTVTTGPLFLERKARPASYAELILLCRPDPPIYVALVSEWRAAGRMVPGARDEQWTALAADTFAVTGCFYPPTTPPGQGRWEPGVQLSLWHRTEPALVR